MAWAIEFFLFSSSVLQSVLKLTYILEVEEKRFLGERVLAHTHAYTHTQIL